MKNFCVGYRNKKPVNYSQFENSESDAPMICILEGVSLWRMNEMALDDKLYQRDLQVALALSAKELPTVTIDVEGSQDLDKITEEDDVHGAQGRRKAASKAVVQQRKMLLEGSDGDSANDSEPDFATGEDSEDDSDFSESEDNDKDFTMRKSKEIKKKEMKVKSPVVKKEKKAKSKCNSLVDSAPAAVKSESQPSSKKVSLSSEATRKPLQIRSPSTESKRPKWVPPGMHRVMCFLSAVSGRSSTSSSPLAGEFVKSPNQSLRLGLSRLARVKPLHPNTASS
ncbi:hypothetical protein QTO34_017224 [Cnephaeus nilssonii]|uniref:RAD51 interacting motif domain-containing protein n=1 Tax=Cnephaeus nilssonii TaxID=3371016 RepID=A0AA40LPM3_CNENI|nr:hypothetical protein QTO34_017224 [Eptesicus nilssonii]